MANDVTATLCTDSPILISKAAVQAYVTADFRRPSKVKTSQCAKSHRDLELRLWQNELQKHLARRLTRLRSHSSMPKEHARPRSTQACAPTAALFVPLALTCLRTAASFVAC
jgi:hypothetical protein